MKKLVLLTLFAAASLGASAQYYQDAINKDMLHIRQPRTKTRVEFNAPDIDGYKAFKADLHTHTIYSDGHFSMEGRIEEAWRDGMDIMAVTEHLEYRPHEKTLVKYLKGYMPKGTKAQAYSFVSRNRPASSDEIKVDFNVPVEEARTIAKSFDMTIIPGIEITRKEGEYSHFNALFTTDNNTIYAPETIQSLRNAKAQGALVMHNHPGWRHLDMKLTKFEKEVYKEKLIDGIEIMNGTEFYPQAITRSYKYGLFMASCTDVHTTSAERYGSTGARRNMTLIYAKDKSLASLREAIEAHRTLAYSFGTLAGSEELLRKFFLSSVSGHKTAADHKGRAKLILTNTSSVDWLISLDGANMIELRGNSSAIVSWDPSKENKLTIHNTWYGENEHLTLDLDSCTK